MRVRHRLRRLFPHGFAPLHAMQVMCGYWIPYVDYLPRELLDDINRPPAPPAAAGPPPGHPERLAAPHPLSAAERELWAALDGLGR